MKLKELDREFSVCKVEDYSLVDLSAEYSFIGKTDEENSLVCATGDVPSNVVERDGWWRGFRIQGMLDFPLIGLVMPDFHAYLILVSKSVLLSSFAVCGITSQ